MDMVKLLFILAIPLNFIGFVIKYLTKIPNFLIVIFLTIISYFTIKHLAVWFNLANETELVKFSRNYSIAVTAMATYSWDFASGVKKLISGLMGIKKKTQLLEESMEEKLKEYRKGILKKVLTIFFTDLLMAIVCFSIKAPITVAIDYLIYTTLIAIGTVIIEDITNKVISDKEKLNVQYFIVFVLAFVSIGAFTVAYFSTDWKVFIASMISSGFFIALDFFLIRFSYIPSLRSKDEVTQDFMKKKWKTYEKMDDAEIIEDMLKTIKYYFKKDVWGAELNLENPMFLGDKGVAQTPKGASFARGNNQPIDKVVPYFKKVIDTRKVVE